MINTKVLAVAVTFAILAVPLYSARKAVPEPEPVVETIRLSGEDSAMIASKISAAQNLVKSMMQDDIETADLIPILKETEKIFDSLKSSTDTGDPSAMKDLLLARLAGLENKAQDRIYLHKRMNLFYQIMVVSGMIVIVVLIVYSIYMFSKRK